MKTYLATLLLIGYFCITLTGCGAMVLGGPDARGQEVGANDRSPAEISHDNRITNTINSIYVKDIQVNAMDIGVRTYRGIVTLRGHVHSQADARQAVQLATGVTGVSKVVSRLEVLAH